MLSVSPCMIVIGGFLAMVFGAFMLPVMIHAFRQVQQRLAELPPIATHACRWGAAAMAMVLLTVTVWGSIKISMNTTIVPCHGGRQEQASTAAHKVISLAACLPRATFKD